MITGNKGEWSEIYTLLKVVADRTLFTGDANLNRIESLIFPVIKVLRDESIGTFEFGYDRNLVVVKNGEEVIRISVLEFKKQAHFLLTQLKLKTNSTFAIPEIEIFLNSFGSQSLKAKSSVKSDIRIIIHDQRTATEPELGFSIKSQLGGASTLLNAGRTTNFIYQIENVILTSLQISEINNIDTRDKIKSRLSKIKLFGGDLIFKRTENSIFEDNLTLIDSALPNIMASIILMFFTSNLSKLSDLVSEISLINPIGYNLTANHPFYSYKIKRFITDVALGMMPSKVWSGELDTTGGYLIVKDDGEIVCYHIYNRNEFEDYLFSNTKLETASSTRHHYGKIYQNEGKLFINLNLQIRFL